MRKNTYERPSISVIVSEIPAILAGSQGPYGHSKEGGIDFGWDEDGEEGGTTPLPSQSFDDEDEE